MHHFGPFEVAIAFFMFLAVAAVAGIVADYKKRQLALEPLRAAIERGLQLDPQLVEGLMTPEARDEPLNPVYLKVGGIVTIATGIGVALLSFFVAQVAPEALYPLLGAGVVAVCVGAGLMIAARAVARHVQQQQDRPQGTRGP
ncbi:MAG TPA: hypothetical protein VH111_12585 [Steroidobacteraceae bacterium]|nr:hypothetical protein [Steroidobacteraceae bacterium]